MLGQNDYRVDNYDTVDAYHAAVDVIRGREQAVDLQSLSSASEEERNRIYHLQGHMDVEKARTIGQALPYFLSNKRLR